MSCFILPIWISDQRPITPHVVNLGTIDSNVDAKLTRAEGTEWLFALGWQELICRGGSCFRRFFVYTGFVTRTFRRNSNPNRPADAACDTNFAKELSLVCSPCVRC